MTVPPPTGAPEPPITYLGGTWVALATHDVVVLADLPADSRAWSAAWVAATAGQGLDGVLAAITDGGPQPATDFVGVALTPEGTRVVLAGRARAELAGSPLTSVEGHVDQRVPGRPPVLLRGPAGGTGRRAALPLVLGIVEASVVGIGVVAADSTSTTPPPVAPTPPPPADPVPVPRVSADTMPPASVYDSGLISALPWRGTAEEPAVPAAPSEPPAPPAPTAQPVPPVVRETPAYSPYAPPASPPEAHPHNPWAPAAASSPPIPGTPPGAAWASAAPQSPWAPGGGQPTTAPPPPPPQPAETSGPMVHAFACPRGHLNPPYAGSCRLCGEPIPPQEGFAAPRPSLGFLKLSTGDTVPLDRDVVLGRAPFHADESAASRPHLVQLSSPGNDISRSHLRVNLENWFVQVTDLGSTNGTVVTLPDQAPVRLRPHDPFTILPGTTVVIADEVTLRYEVQ